jgi:hypothetical protein
MTSANAICALAALFIAGMAWLRTRMHYARGAPGGRRLTATGVRYFVAFALLLVSGWFLAPLSAAWLSPAAPVTPILARVVWFLGSYYLFIPVHLMLKARGLPVFDGERSGRQHNS